MSTSADVASPTTGADGAAAVTVAGGAGSAVRAVTPAGLDAAVWADRIRGAPERSLSELAVQYGWSDPARLLVLAAHPDDESLGCGQLMHLWRRRGPVAAVTATAGEACFDHVLPRPPSLAERRLEEWRRALAWLDAAPYPCSGLPDGQLSGHETVLEAHLNRLLDGLLDQQPDDDVVLAAPWRHDPHPDHRAAGRVATRVAAERGLVLIEYPVWMRYWADPDATRDLDLVRLRSDADAARAARSAQAEFVSQTTPPAPHLGPVLPPEMLADQDQQVLVVTAPS